MGETVCAPAYCRLCGTAPTAVVPPPIRARGARGNPGPHATPAGEACRKDGLLAHGAWRCQARRPRPLSHRALMLVPPMALRQNLDFCRDCSRATGFIQPVHDEVLPGFVDGLRRRLHATYPTPGAHGSALASAPGRHSFAFCDSADCSAPPHARWRAATCHRET